MAQPTLAPTVTPVVATLPITTGAIPVASQTVAPATATTYASQWNARYTHQGADYVDLKDRFNRTLSGLPIAKQKAYRHRLTAAINALKAKHPTYTQFSDMKLVKVGYAPLSDILIDVTIQRLLDLAWVLHILENFREMQAQPVQVYEVQEDPADLDYHPAGTKLYASWDAQHTAIVYWVIAVMIYGQDPRTVMVPINIYDISSRADIRKNFVDSNSEAGKKLLDKIDLFIQMIFGVRLDKSTEPSWQEASLKQTHLEDADLFATAEKYNNTGQDGAISRMQEIDRYNSEVIRQFALYTTTFPTPRPIDSQEIEIMCAFLDMAKGAGITYTDAEILELGDLLHKLFGADFHESSPFWGKVKTAYTNWWNTYYANVPASHRPANTKMSKNWNSGGTFLWHQLQKSWPGHQLPNLSSSTPFIPAITDLY